MSKMKEKMPVKKFDAVKEMRKIRDKISLDIKDMDYKQLKEYFKQPRLLKSKWGATIRYVDVFFL